MFIKTISLASTCLIALEEQTSFASVTKKCSKDTLVWEAEIPLQFYHQPSVLCMYNEMALKRNYVLHRMNGMECVVSNVKGHLHNLMLFIVMLLYT